MSLWRQETKPKPLHLVNNMVYVQTPQVTAELYYNMQSLLYNFQGLDNPPPFKRVEETPELARKRKNKFRTLKASGRLDDQDWAVVDDQFQYWEKRVGTPYFEVDACAKSTPDLGHPQTKL